MMKKFHGVFSLILFAVSLIIGSYVLINDSIITGIIYIEVIAVSIPVILYSYCSKCNCRLDSCGHIIPGMLTKVLPDRPNRHYNALDYIGVALPLAVLAMMPQLSLWGNKLLFSLFWLFFVVALFEILLFVCRGCRNDKCPIYIRQ